MPKVEAGGNQRIFLGEFVNLNGSSNGSSFVWSPVSTLSDSVSLSPVAAPEQTTIYTLTAQLNGCQSSDTVVISVNTNFLVPNILTPNGDNINDDWRFEGASQFPDLKATVYNRWGNKIFESSTGYSDAWTGDNVPAGIYFYVIDKGNGDETIKGTVTVLR